MSTDKIQVKPRDESLNNSPIGNQAEDTTVIADTEAKCYWNDAAFNDGDNVCADGVPYECHYGSWMRMTGEC